MPYQLAQVNIARMREPLESALLADFVAQLDDINALAEASPGFVWRLQTEAGNATSVRAYDDELMLFNLSVWDSVEALRAYVFQSAHKEVLKQRDKWFHKFEGFSTALWWVPVGHQPTIAEARARLEHLQTHGSTPHAFTFQQPFPPPHTIA